MEYLRNPTQFLRVVATAVILLSSAGPAMSDDGALEINQACAAEGCGEFDTAAGFPVTLADPGSYMLTSNLTVSTNVAAISIQANNVTLDLNGFSLIGPDSGTANGIDTPGAPTDVVIRNGGIQDFGGAGVSIGSPSSNWALAELRISSNGGAGVELIGSGNGFSVRSCHVVGNGGNGIRLPDNAIVADSVVFDNGGIGITLNNGGLVRGNEVSENDGDGIQVVAASVLHNTAIANGEHGIDALANALVHGNTAVNNNTSGGSFANIADCATCTFGTNHAP